MAKKKKRPYAFFCLWEYIPRDNTKERYEDRRRWKLVECYGVDEDGRLCTDSKYVSSRDRRSYEAWTQKKVWYDSETKTRHEICPPNLDEEDFDFESVQGRAVTVWTYAGGVSLASFHPPEYVDWLDVRFSEELQKLKNWYIFIEDGYFMHLETGKAVTKMLFPGEEVF